MGAEELVGTEDCLLVAEVEGGVWDGAFRLLALMRVTVAS